MNVTSRNLALLALGACSVAAALALAWPRQAHSQINAAPAWVPIGVSQSGSTSTAWFHEPGSRQAVACQTSAAAPLGAQCVTVRLP